MKTGLGRSESRSGIPRAGGDSGCPAFGLRPDVQLSRLKKTLPPCFRKDGQRRMSAPQMAVLAAMFFAGYLSFGGTSFQFMPQATAASLPAEVVTAPKVTIEVPKAPNAANVVVAAAQNASPAVLVAPAESAADKQNVMQRIIEYIPDPPPADTDSKYQVQAVLVAKNSAVLSSAIDGRIVDYHYRSGDHFGKGDTLVEFDCAVDRAKLKEFQARQSLSARQLAAYNQLRKLKTVSEIELETAAAANSQSLAQIDQISQHLNLCRIVAPFDGRIMRTMANNYEFAQTGRVLMEVSSREPLQAEFIVSSVWLRWLNVGTPVTIYIDESGKRYGAKLVRINGEVDPVSQSVQVVAELDGYNEELLPGMSGKAIFNTDGADAVSKFGYHGLILDPKPPMPVRPK
ncbi:MAG: efflux RND transporter periplasmic adaptor subunit [Alphaproteobacteria bacterium]|nr:MAG: efflux RND transporter periplasmic adaptor subunit [Alphaproteobacteria bacterium]